MPHRRVRTRQVLLFVLAIGLPCLVLVALSLRMLAQERELAEKRLADERRRMAADVRQDLLTRLERLRLQAAGTVHADPIVLVADAQGDRLLLPWDAQSTGGAALDDPTFSAAAREGEREELVSRRFEAAGAAYRRALGRAHHPAQTAFAQLLLARALARGGHQRAADKLYRTILAAPLAVADEHGIPFALYAARRLLDRPAVADETDAAVLELVRAALACASCHDPERAFTDGRRLAVGVFGRAGRRNVPAIINRAWGRSFFWDGRVTTLEEQVLTPIEDPDEMDLAVSQAARRVDLTVDQLSRALASYVRSILSGNSRYDRFAAGERTALSPEEQAGLQIFSGKGNCTACHVGPTLTDERLHNTGVAWTDRRLLDPGGGNGTFKTPTLREVTRTAPYMHDGSLATLEEVVDYYDRGGNANPFLDPELRPLRLTPGEKNALVAFLRTLNGDVSEGPSQ
ncbi:MAG: c-type cytochrome [Acidobacteria bacterium]|nr:c-type cytochrome [Acidobacteriota bacterium]